MGKIDFFEIGLKANYSFDTLVVGPHNQFAVSACQEVVKKPGEAYNPLFIYGPPGVGKTHLIQAVAQAMLKSNSDLKVKYESAERFMSDILSGIAEDNVFRIREHFSKMDLFIIDDIQYLVESQATQEELLHIFNSMQSQNHQIIVAGDRPPNKLTGLNDTLRSRFEGGLSVDVKIPDQQTRVEILKVKQTAQNLSIPEDQLNYVAQSLAANVRELEGFLKRMHAYVHLSHQQITPQLVQLTVSEILPSRSAQGAPPMGAPPAPQWNYPPPPPQAPTYPPPGMPPQAPYYQTPPQGFEANPNSGRIVPPPSGGPPAAPVQPAPLQGSEPLIGQPGGPPGHAQVEKQDMFQYLNEIPPGAPKPVPAEVNPPITTGPPVDTATPSDGGQPAPPQGEAQVSPPAQVPPAEASVPEELPAGVKEVLAAFFYPEGTEETLELVYNKFQEVIKKHKLKFRLKRVHSEPYSVQGKVNYTSFVDVCKNAKVPVAIVIGPPPTSQFPQQDFYDLLSVTLDVQGISLQLINWSEVSKDYRYLNLSLDIALVKGK